MIRSYAAQSSVTTSRFYQATFTAPTTEAALAELSRLRADAHVKGFTRTWSAEIKQLHPYDDDIALTFSAWGVDP
jgi:hypothetical protein